MSSQWELSTADNVLMSEAATLSAAAGVSLPSDGVYASISSTPAANPYDPAVPATAASAAGARSRLGLDRGNVSPPPAWSLHPLAPPAEIVGSCSAESEMSASHSPPPAQVSYGPAFGSPVPASPFGSTSEVVAASPATPVPPVSPAVPAVSFGGPLSAATGAWTLWEGASDFDFDVPALPSGAHTVLLFSDSVFLNPDPNPEPNFHPIPLSIANAALLHALLYNTAPDSMSQKVVWKVQPSAVMHL